MAALLGEMAKQTGTAKVSGQICYVPQQPWLQNATIKDNILFSKPFNFDKYTEVINGCSLRSDLAVLPGSDRMEIGEKGINLSGGQKQVIGCLQLVHHCKTQIKRQFWKFSV